VRKRKKKVSVKEFVKQCFAEGITSPSEMRDEYNKAFPSTKPKGSDAFTKAMRRMGVTSEDRLTLKHEAQKEKEVLDIEDYEEVRRYMGFSDFGQISKQQKTKTRKKLRELWQMMGYSNPRLWDIDPNSPEPYNLLQTLKKHIGQDENGQWKKPNQVLELLGAFNRTFTGRLPKGYSTGLKREAGELKDFFEFTEMNEYLLKLQDTYHMSKEAWEALYKTQVNLGCREGTKGNTGILSLKWEDINFKTRRCNLRDKGKKGKPARLWTQLPLDLFYWLNGFEALCTYHTQKYGYRPTNERHATGKCFPIAYQRYNRMFHDTRHRCECRINQDGETMIPHIFRKTHAQWAKRIGVSLENLCGDTTSSPCVGFYGVGWDDPKIPMKYYLTPEPEEFAEQEEKVAKRLVKLQSRGVLPQQQPPLIA